MTSNNLLGAAVILVTQFLFVPELGAETVSPTAFTYQGQLDKSGQPVTNQCDFKFGLWTDSNNPNPGVQLGSNITLTAPVNKGTFSAALDFGTAMTNSDARWLQIAVCCASPCAPAYTNLAPRQPLTAAPYSVQTRGIHVAGGGNVGIGTTAPTARLHVAGNLKADGNASASGDVVAGTRLCIAADCRSAWPAGASGVTSIGAGSGLLASPGNPITTSGTVSFDTAFGDGRYARLGASNNFVGTQTATVFSGTALVGSNSSDSGVAVAGYASSPTGSTTAVYGENSSNVGTAVAGWAPTLTGNTLGGLFQSDSDIGTGVRGYAPNGSGTTNGVQGVSDSTSGTGVEGIATSGTGTTFGVLGKAYSGNGHGVYGAANASTGLTYGVYGVSYSTSGIGVYGRGFTNTGTNYGVKGDVNNATGYGGYFKNYDSGGISLQAATSTDGPALSVKANGNVGVGTATPQFPLHVVGAVSASTGLQARVDNLSTSGHSFATFSAIANNGTLVSLFSADGLGTGPMSAASAYLGTYSNHALGFITNNVKRMIILPNGSVGIGTLGAADLLQVGGDIRVGSGSTGCVKDADGTVIAGVCSSDLRFKHSIVPFGAMLDRVAALRPVHFKWRQAEYPEKHFGDGVSFGLVAQDVAQVLPELVTEDENGFKAIRYNKLPLLAIQAIGELKAENDDLREELRQLRELVDGLQQLFHAEEERTH